MRCVVKALRCVVKALRCVVKALRCATPARSCDVSCSTETRLGAGQELAAIDVVVAEKIAEDPQYFTKEAKPERATGVSP